MKVPFYDLRAAHKECAGETEKAVLKVLRSGEYVSGKEVEQFEEKFAQYLSAPYVVAVNSGTAALHLALLALGVKPGDEVIIPSFTFAATAEAALYCGATPVFVDIDESTYTIDPEAVRAAITAKTVGMILVHLYGQMADMEALTAIGRKHKLWIIEDACQAHGASLNGKKAGLWGDLAAFSFYPTKNLGGIGEGGVVVSREKKYLEYIKMARSHGSAASYQHTLLGYNYRLNEIQAAVLSVKLAFLDQWNVRRREAAHAYNQAFANTTFALPKEAAGAYQVYNQYIISLNNRDALRAYLNTHGIETRIYYPTPLHLQPAFRETGRVAEVLTRSERAASSVLSIPIGPHLSKRQQGYVIDKILAFGSI